jgi:hypothetical protein
VTLVEAIADRTTRTPSGGGFWLGSNYLSVRYCVDSWEWEYLGTLFYDLEDLAEEILRRNDAGSRLVRYYTGCFPDQRKERRLQVTHSQERFHES